MMPYIFLKNGLIRGSSKITHQIYAGFGVGIIFHPLTNVLDTSLSQKMGFKFRITYVQGVLLSLIVTSTLWSRRNEDKIKRICPGKIFSLKINAWKLQAIIITH